MLEDQDCLALGHDGGSRKGCSYCLSNTAPRKTKWVNFLEKGASARCAEQRHHHRSSAWAFWLGSRPGQAYNRYWAAGDRRAAVELKECGTPPHESSRNHGDDHENEQDRS